MKKLIPVLLSLFILSPCMANIHISPVALNMVVYESVPSDKRTAVLQEYKAQLEPSPSDGISAQKLWNLCTAAGWDIKTSDGKSKCQDFVNTLVRKSTISMHMACDKKYKGKSGYICVDKFFTNKVYGGTQVNIGPALALAKEYIRIKHNDTSVQCAQKPRFITVMAGATDYGVQCTSRDKDAYYELIFDDTYESEDKKIKNSIQTAICKMYDADAQHGTCDTDTDLSSGNFGELGTGMACYPATCAADSAKCAKINESMKIFGYSATYKNKKCEIDFQTIKNKEDLKTAYGIDNFVFCHGIQVSNTPTIETYLKQYVAEQANVSASSVKCDAGFKTYTGTGCAVNGMTDLKDDVKTCHVGKEQIDFVFNDINEAMRTTATGGTQGVSCIISGGTYSGQRCIGLGEQQCNVLRQSNLTECPECKAAKWDTKTQSCILPSSASAHNLQKGINISIMAGFAVAGAVITIATGGTAGAIVLTAIETAGAAIEITAQTKINTIADSFLVESNKCKDATCARKMLAENLQRMANYANDMTDAEANAVDSEMARLAGLIPDDDELWATMLVKGTDMADNKLSFFDLDSWEPEQVWRAVGIGLQLASVVSSIGKWIGSKANRIAKSPAAIKQKFDAAIDSVDKAQAITRPGPRLELKQKVTMQSAVDAVSKKYASDTDAAWRELFEKYGARNHNSIDEFKEITDGDLAKMQELSKSWVSWDEAADPNLTFAETQKQIEEYLQKHPDAQYYYQNSARLKEDELKIYATEHRDLMLLEDKQNTIMQIQDQGVFVGNYSTHNTELSVANREIRSIDANVYMTQKSQAAKNLNKQIANKEITLEEGKKLYQQQSSELKQNFGDNSLRKLGTFVSETATDRVALLRAQQMQEIIGQNESLLAKKANWKSLSINEKEEFANELATALMKKNGINKNHPPVESITLKPGNGGHYNPKDKKIRIDFHQHQEFDHFINVLSHETSHAIDRINPNSGSVGGQLYDASKSFFGKADDAYLSKPTEQSSWKIGAYTEILNSTNEIPDILLDALNGSGPIKVYDYEAKQVLRYKSSGYDTQKLLADLFDSNKDIRILINSNTPSARQNIIPLIESGHFQASTTTDGKFYLIKAIKPN